MERLGNARALTKDDFWDNAYTNEMDVVVFVYSSDKTHESWKR